MRRAVSTSQEIPRLGRRSGAIAAKLWRVISSASLQTHKSPPAVADYTQQRARDAHTRTHRVDGSSTRRPHLKTFTSVIISRALLFVWGKVLRCVFQTVGAAVWKEERRQPWKSFCRDVVLLCRYFLTEARAAKTQYLRVGDSLFFHRAKTQRDLVIASEGGKVTGRKQGCDAGHPQAS